LAILGALTALLLLALWSPPGTPDPTGDAPPASPTIDAPAAAPSIDAADAAPSIDAADAAPSIDAADAAPSIDAAAPSVPRSLAVPPAPTAKEIDEANAATDDGGSLDLGTLELPPDPPPPMPVEPPPAPAPEPVVEIPLPAVEPEVEPSPEEQAAEMLADILPPPAQPVASEDRPWFAVKVFIGLVGLLALAYLGGHPMVQRIERKLGVSRVVAAGFPFLALGLLANRYEILSDDVLAHLRPVLHLALGWIGVVIGMRIELGKLSALPRGAVSIVGIGTGIPLAMIVAGCSAVLVMTQVIRGGSWLDATIVRDALVLGAAGAIAADTETLRFGARRASPEAQASLVQLANLDELAALVGLAFLNAYFRPSGVDVTWQIPSTAWLFVTFGLALMLGLVVYATLRLPSTRTESLALLLGSVAFASGIASTLHLSPLVVCFMVGMLLANFPGDYKRRLADNLARLEMPIYLVFLLVAGALWRPTLLGWALMLVLLGTRYVGRWAGGRLVWRSIDDHLPVDARRSLVFAPMGTLPIAVAVNAALLYPDSNLSTILTATIGGAILSEMALALLWRREELVAGSSEARA
jgi:hypothetical protein